MSAVMSGPFQRGGASNRAFNYAVIGSLIFHGVLLFVISLEKQSSQRAAAPGPIVARLVAPAAKPVPPQPEPPKPKAEERPKPPPPVVKPAPVQKPSPIPVPVRKETKAAPAPVAPPQPVAPPVADPTPAAPAAPSAPSAPVARVDPKPSDAPVVDAGSLETYRVELIAMMRRYKRYPRVALDNNWEGKVVLRMVIGANGMISSLTVISSAGHEVLDKQALDMIQKAKGRVPIPPALRGKEYPVEVPVVFETKDQGSG